MNLQLHNTQTPFIFPTRAERLIVATDLMLELEGRILAVHALCGLVVCYGSAGAGKTTLGEWMTARCNAAFSPENPHAFKAIVYEVAKTTIQGNPAKRAMRSLYVAVSGMPFDEGLYNRLSTEEMADLIVTVMRRNRVQLVFVDEAGLLSLDAINGLILVSDKARQEQFPVTFVLIGMDDLPQKLDIDKRPQISRRIHAWCYLEHHTLEETETLLRALHPHFAALGGNAARDYEQIKFVHEISHGLPGYIVQFISHFDSQYRKMPPGMIDLIFLKAVHIRNVQSRNTILAQAKNKGRAIVQKGSKND